VRRAEMRLKIRTVPMPQESKRERAEWLPLAEAVYSASQSDRAVEVDASGIDAHAMRSAIGQQLLRRGRRLRTSRRGDVYLLWAVEDK
jgi:hypothetical protein